MGENPAALRAAVFFAILEKPEGGGAFKRPPAGRGIIQDKLDDNSIISKDLVDLFLENQNDKKTSYYFI